MNPSFFYALAQGIQYLGLALMIGGMLAIGAFAAPAIFKQVARPEAGEILTMLFRRYDIVIVASLIMIVLGEGVKFMISGLPEINITSGLRLTVLVAMVGLTLFSVFSINAQIEQSYKDGSSKGSKEQVQAFHKTHDLSEKLYKIEMMAAIVILMMTPFIPTKLP